MMGCVGWMCPKLQQKERDDTQAARWGVRGVAHSCNGRKWATRRQHDGVCRVGVSEVATEGEGRHGGGMMGCKGFWPKVRRKEINHTRAA